MLLKWYHAFDQNKSIFRPHYVRWENTFILILNKLEKIKIPAKTFLHLNNTHYNDTNRYFVYLAEKRVVYLFRVP